MSDILTSARRISKEAINEAVTHFYHGVDTPPPNAFFQMQRAIVAYEIQKFREEIEKDLK